MSDFAYRTGKDFRALPYAAQLDVIHGWLVAQTKESLKHHENVAYMLGYGPTE